MASIVLANSFFWLEYTLKAQCWCRIYDLPTYSEGVV